MPGQVTRLRYRVIFGDTDQAGMVYHANYLRWFEAARCELLRERGMSYTEMNRAGVSFPVVEAQARYRRPARFEDLVIVETRVGEVRGATIRFDYVVFREGEPDPIAEGHTLHACTDPTGRPVRIPPRIRALVAT